MEDRHRDPASIATAIRLAWHAAKVAAVAAAIPSHQEPPEKSERVHHATGFHGAHGTCTGSVSESTSHLRGGPADRIPMRPGLRYFRVLSHDPRCPPRSRARADRPHP